MNKPPTEAQEAAVFVQWMRHNGLVFHHSPNETGHTAEAQRRAIRVKREGTSKGFPDYVVLVSPEDSKDGEGYMVYIELKRVKGSVTSPEQLKWVNDINALNHPNIQAYVAKGSGEAIKIVNHYLKRNNTLF